VEHRSTLARRVLALILAAGAFAFIIDTRADQPRQEDAAITLNVQRAILKATSLKAVDIRVETLGGVVRLHGFVDTMDEISRAAEIARRVEGVGAVRNDLRVANKSSRA
jgi:osmotically-inducible protein OsmY